MQCGWLSIARELGCNHDDHKPVFDAIAADLARHWWARDEAEQELAEIACGVVRSDPAGSRLRPHLSRASPEPAGEDGQAVEIEPDV